MAPTQLMSAPRDLEQSFDRGIATTDGKDEHMEFSKMVNDMFAKQIPGKLASAQIWEAMSRSEQIRAHLRRCFTTKRHPAKLHFLMLDTRRFRFMQDNIQP